MLQQGHRQFVVDLAGVPYMDSGGLALLHVTDRLRDLLVITRLVTVFDCYDIEEAALAHVAAKA